MSASRETEARNIEEKDTGQANFKSSFIFKADPECLFFKVFLSRSHILELDLSYPTECYIDIKTATILMGLLMKNSSLACLNLSACFRYENLAYSIEVCKLLSGLLEINQNLVNLQLLSNEFTDECMTHLAQGLKQNNVLKKLDLSYNAIGDKGIQSISEMLNANPAQQLQQLNLKQNKIGPVGAKALATFLQNPRCQLQSLDLSGNEIGDEGFKAIAESLGKNTSLKTLNIQRNKISGHEGALAFAKALRTNNTLVDLFSVDPTLFEDNEMGSKGVSAIIQSLKLNHTVRHLSFVVESPGLFTNTQEDLEYSLIDCLKTSNHSLCYFHLLDFPKAPRQATKQNVQLSELLERNRKLNASADYNLKLISPLIASFRTENDLKPAVIALMPQIMAYTMPTEKEDGRGDLPVVGDKTKFSKVDLNRFSYSRFFCSETNTTFFARPKASRPMEYNYEIENCRVM